MAHGNRPLSPHLQVYRPQITSILSITHRMTGVALAGSCLFFAYWLTSATYGEAAFANAQSLFSSWFGQLILIGLTFSLYFHLANGIRHLFWDAGHGFELDTLRQSGWLVIVFTLGMTGLTMAMAYAVGAG